MQRLVTSGVVLRRVNYGEADRIITVLTPDYGKLSLMAKGVRKSKSKLAGGIELFSVSQVIFVRGRGDIGTLVSSRLEKHYANATKELPRIQLGYEMLKAIDKNTEGEAEADYFKLLDSSLSALDDQAIPLPLTKIYFEINLLKLTGHMPNLESDTAGQALAAERKYGFDAVNASFTESGNGQYSTGEIKFLRLAFSGNSAKALSRISDAEKLANLCQPLVSAMTRTYLRV